MSCEYLTREGTQLALHRWTCPEPAAVLFYVHGTQSHAGWLFQTGPRLASASVTVWALDRRGSGASEGIRGDAESFHEWLDDYHAALALVRDRHPHLPLTILGQSLGGCIATALAVKASTMYEALLLSAPAYDLLHGRIPGEKIARIRRERPGAHFPVKVTDEQYTKDSDLLDFMQRDDKMARALTGRFLASQLDLEEHLRNLPPASLPGPSGLILAQGDSLVDPPAVRQRFQTLAPSGRIVELPGAEHYLEFSSVRNRWWELVSAFARSAGSSFGSAPV